MYIFRIFKKFIAYATICCTKYFSYESASKTDIICQKCFILLHNYKVKNSPSPDLSS